MRGKGEGALFRVPKDTKQPLKYWTAIVELPPRDGQRRRKVVRAKDKRVALAKLQEVQKDLAASGDLPTASMQLQAWLRHWFADIQIKRIGPKTIAVYRTMLEQYIIPSIGATRLDKLSAEHVHRLHRYITDTKGLSSTTASQAHRVLSIALRDAQREGRVTRNVATFVDAPKRAVTKLVTLDAEDGIRILATAATPDHARLGSRWAAALLTGARQGELLGLEIDRVTDVLDLSWQLQRFRWSHGCPPDKHCPWKQGSKCPWRHLEAPVDREYRHVTGGLWFSRPKSSAGWRIVPLVEPLKSILLRRMEKAATEANPHGLMWTNPDGSPIDPKEDNQAWHRILAEAGVKDARLHDARHTTVDLLYEAGVPEQLITEIVGHSTVGMTRRYKSRGNQEQLRDAMTRMSKLLTQ